MQPGKPPCRLARLKLFLGSSSFAAMRPLFAEPEAI
jgi:hypothetical protein